MVYKIVAVGPWVVPILNGVRNCLFVDFSPIKNLHCLVGRPVNPGCVVVKVVFHNSYRLSAIQSWNVGACYARCFLPNKY